VNKDIKKKKIIFIICHTINNYFENKRKKFKEGTIDRDVNVARVYYSKIY